MGSPQKDQQRFILEASEALEDFELTQKITMKLAKNLKSSLFLFNYFA